MILFEKRYELLPGKRPYQVSGLLTIKANGYREQWSFRGFPEVLLRQVFKAIPAAEKYLEVIRHHG